MESTRFQMKSVLFIWQWISIGLCKKEGPHDCRSFKVPGAEMLAALELLLKKPTVSQAYGMVNSNHARSPYLCP